jgi:hypothetical protein
LTIIIEAPQQEIEMELNGKKVFADVADVCSWDYPDFCDAHFENCFFEDGTELTDEEVQQLHDKYPDVLAEMAYASLH